VRPGGPPELRPLRAADEPAARDLIDRSFPPYLRELPHYHLTLALGDTASDESRGIVVTDGDRLAGVVLHGFVAGAVRTGKIHVLAVRADIRRRGIGRALLDAATRALASADARLIVVELPADPDLEAVRPMLHESGFREEASVGDFVRDGVALLVLVRGLSEG
jgi:ribosomal protein S18 acetylase RimI-like enzyme